MSHYVGDECPGGHWEGSWVRSAGESASLAHTVRRLVNDERGTIVTYCGVRIERPSTELAPRATDCYGCRTRRDR